ncbi:uncharacterized protein LOC131284466 [Anopheles ziemanni]|uniref:uncharacterized protein LOC131258871 n=1 Tax=Anopheles coustani TaxID=139045 RepID=UPI0026598971|nr:uncharacterized protein LOC131258871 [Anopheles coustani]XP_058169309.1 uncharacterized protein LOC131284466 [Anopheles ziemanni]
MLTLAASSSVGRWKYTVTARCLPAAETITTYTIPTPRPPSIATVHEPPNVTTSATTDPSTSLVHGLPQTTADEQQRLIENTAEGSNITSSSHSGTDPTSSRAYHNTVTNADKTNLLSIGNTSAGLPEDSSSSSSSTIAKLIVDLGRETGSTSTTATAASDTSTTITANSYSRNKSTTRSWPVIHRNNSYYRYYQGSSGSGGSGGGSGGGAAARPMIRTTTRCTGTVRTTTTFC